MSACPHCGQDMPHLTLAPEPASSKARATDPSTSRAAARLAFPKQGTVKLRILAALRLCDDGATARQLSELTGLEYTTVSTRITDLIDGSWLYRTGTTRRTSTGRQAVVVAVTDLAREKLENYYRGAAA